MNKPIWASTEEVCSAVGIGRTRLMDLKASNELLAGQHWVYLSGRRNSPLGWDLDAVRTWQVEKTKELAKAPFKAADAIESFAEMGV